MTDNVNHPAHYTDGKYEVIDLIRTKQCNIANIIKYISRAGKKHDKIEDLQKAIWYAEDLKAYLELDEKVNNPDKDISYEDYIEEKKLSSHLTYALLEILNVEEALEMEKWHHMRYHNKSKTSLDHVIENIKREIQECE